MRWLLVLAAGAAAATTPSADFLEYLGQWDETDEDWMVIDRELSESAEPAKTSEDDDDERDD